MCGIIRYKGFNKCLPILIDRLKKLEYRGYYVDKPRNLAKGITVE